MSEILPRTRGGVILRRLRTSDLRAFQSYRCDPRVGLYQGWSASTDVEAEGFLEVMGRAPLLQANDWTQLAIADAASDTLIGDIGIHIEERSAEIGFTLAPTHQGRGLATLAVTMAIEMIFELTAVESVEATTDARNERSIRLLERVGMSRIESRAAMFRGAPCVEHHYRLHRSERLATNSHST